MTPGAPTPHDRAPALPLSWGIASKTLPGEKVSGDRHLVEPFAGGALLAVVDGLGHGADATAAAERAVGILREHAGESVISLVNRCHEGLRATRGAVMSLASYRASDETITWTGVGNVDVVLVRAVPGAAPAREDILLRAGVVGYQLSPLRATVLPVAPGDLVVFATDGVSSAFKESLTPGEEPAECARRVLSRFLKASDDALVLAARILGRGRS